MDSSAAIMASANLAGLWVILPLRLGADVDAVSGVEALGMDACGVDARLEGGSAGGVIVDLTGKEATRIVSPISGFTLIIAGGAVGGTAGGAAVEGAAFKGEVFEGASFEGMTGKVTGGSAGGAAGGFSGGTIGGLTGGSNGSTGSNSMLALVVPGNHTFPRL